MTPHDEVLADPCVSSLPGSPCASCAEDAPECEESRRTCRHHCDHVWADEPCCWCFSVFLDPPEDSDDFRGTGDAAR